MGTYYLQVAEDQDAEPMEMPTETDGSLLLSTLSAQFPGVSGLKFRNQESGGMRGVRLVDGRFHAPEKDGWGDNIYYCVLQKVDNKRKWDSGDEGDSPKNKRFENKLNQRCSDLIVLDLPWKATEEEMREYFEGFGDIILAQVKKDMKTGQSKGYGFIRFSNYESQIRVLGQRHFIQGRWCDVKIPNSKDSQQSNISPKIYVGRLTEEITSDDLRDYFSKFGEVTHVFTPKPYRAFAFVTFTHADVAQSLCGEDHIIKGTSVYISNAAPKSDSRGDSSRHDHYQHKESSSRDQNSGMQGSPDVQSIWNTSGSNGGRGGGGGGVMDLVQVASSGGVGNGNSQVMMNAALGNYNLSSQLNQAIVSAVLNQAVMGFVGGQLGSPQQQQQQQLLQHQQHQGGGRSLSPQNYGKQSSSGFGYQTAQQGSQGRLREA